MEERVLVLIAQSLQPAGPRHRRRCRRRFAPAAGLCARGPAAASWSLGAIALFDLTLFVSFRFQFCGPTSRQDYVALIFEVSRDDSAVLRAVRIMSSRFSKFSPRMALLSGPPCPGTAG